MSITLCYLKESAEISGIYMCVANNSSLTTICLEKGAYLLLIVIIISHVLTLAYLRYAPSVTVIEEQFF